MTEEGTDSEREGRIVTIIPADTFGHRLLLVRAHLGHMTVKDAAERCGLNYGAWSKWERGSMPRDKVDVADAIAEGLGIDRDWLLHGGQLTKPPTTRVTRRTYLRSPIARPGRSSPPDRRVRRPRRVDGRHRMAA
jgi:transcriptional regulator with XRE-family HTH domain